MVAEGTKIVVVGVGGGGCNALDRMRAEDLQGVELIAMNTDLASLQRCRVEKKIRLGSGLTNGSGTGGDPQVGRMAALEDADAIVAALDGADLVFLTAGLGGGTGSGAVPIIGSLAAEIGALAIAVVTMPFSFEGRRRSQIAQKAVEEIQQSVDTVIAIPNERLLSFVDRGTPLSEAFKVADEVLTRTVRGISDLIKVPGEVDVDFADVQAVLTGMGMAVMGTGEAAGPDRARVAAQQAIGSPFLEGVGGRARGVLLNISGGPQMTLHEVAEAARVVAEFVDADANIISGMVIDHQLGDVMKVTMIAAGFDLVPSDGEAEAAAGPRPGEPTAEDGVLEAAHFVVVWDPDTVDPEDYAELIADLGDLVRDAGGVGLRRVRELEVGVLSGRGVLA